jgi:hypothetical protein
LPNLSRNVEPVQIGHLEVQQDHIRPIIPNPFERLAAGPSLVANSPRTLLFKQASKIMAHYRIVICHENTNQAKPFLSFH